MSHRPARPRLSSRSAACLAALTVVGVGLSGGVPAPAPAAATMPEVIARTSKLVDGPALLGPRIVYLVYGRRDYRILEAGPGRAPRAIYRAALASGVGPYGASGIRRDSETVSFAAADGWLAVQTSLHGPDLSSASSVTLSAGRLGGPLRRVDGCTVRHGALRLMAVAGPFALSGGLLAYVPAACTTSGVQGDGLALLDLTTGQLTTPPRAPATVVESVRVAGRYVAFTQVDLVRDTRDLVVYDRTAGGVAYRSALGSPVGNAAVDVDQAGRTAIVLGGQLPPEDCTPGFPSPGRLELATLEHPQPALLPQLPCSAPPRLVGDRIVFVRGTASGLDLLTSTDLAGAQRQDLASLGTRGMSPGSIDADPTQAVFVLTACDGRSEIERTAVSRPNRIVAQTPDCPVVLPSVARIAPRTARLELGCPRGCRGEARLDLPGGSPLATGRFTIHGRRGTLTLRLSSAARTAACSSARLRLTLTVALRDDTFEPVRRSRLLAGRC